MARDFPGSRRRRRLQNQTLPDTHTICRKPFAFQESWLVPGNSLVAVQSAVEIGLHIYECLTKAHGSKQLGREKFTCMKSCIAPTCGIDSDKLEVYCGSRRRLKGLAKIKRC